MPPLLSLCSGARELQLLKPVCFRAHAPQQEKPLQGEAHAPQLREEPLLATIRESQHVATQTQPKIISKKKISQYRSKNKKKEVKEGGITWISAMRKYQEKDRLGEGKALGIGGEAKGRF